MPSPPNIEWLRSFYFAFGAVVGETTPVGDPLDVSDLEVVHVQVNVLASNAANDADVKWRCETSLTTDNYPYFETCATLKDLPKTPGQSSVLRIDENSTVPLRRWLRFVLYHGVATAGQAVTIQVVVQAKKRVA